MNATINKVWLITGCSTGLGRAFATTALAKGYRVAVTARKTNDVADIVNKYPDQAIVLQLDVTGPEDIKAAVRRTKDRFGRIDILVNNAGIGYSAPLKKATI